MSGPEAISREAVDLTYPEYRQFWEAADHGRFIVPRCNQCGKVHWFPRPFCPICHSSDVAWIEASGRATLYSFTVMHSPAGQPYVLAYVTLAEGPIMMTNIVDCDPDSLAIGMAVEVEMRRDSAALPAPYFRPSAP